MTEDFLSQWDAPDLARSRLCLFQAHVDPLTVQQLDAIGVGEGWRCLAVGAGAGSVRRMLAERVGRTGSVRVLDVGSSLVEALASDRIEAYCHDLLSDSLPEHAFELAHARWLFMHLPSRLEALRRLARVVRAGGWVAAMEPDFTTVALSPTNLTWERTWSLFCDVLLASGWDPRYGARLCDDMRLLGLVEVRAEYVATCDAGGSIIGRLLSMTLEGLRERMLALGADSEELAESQRLLEHPTSTIRGPTTCAVVGRRPLPHE